MPILDRYPIPNPGVVGRVVSDEAVLVLPVKGEVKVLNEVGARIWSLADGTRTVGDIAALICSEYTVNLAEAQVDTHGFLTQLAERGVISWSDKPVVIGK